jgi:hypothetical protein
VRNPAAFRAATKLTRRSDAANPFAVVPNSFERGQVAPVVCWLNATSSKAAGSFYRKPSRLAARLGACFREEKLAEIGEIRVNFSPGKPRYFRHFKFFKKPLAWERTFDILCAPFRLRAGPRSRWRAAWSNWAKGQQLQTDN